MVLPHDNVFPVLQPNLKFKDTQKDIISNLTLAAWTLRQNHQQFQQMLNFLEREEEHVELLRGMPEVKEEVVVNRLAEAPMRP